MCDSGWMPRFEEKKTPAYTASLIAHSAPPHLHHSRVMMKWCGERGALTETTTPMKSRSLSLSFSLFHAPLSSFPVCSHLSFTFLWLTYFDSFGRRHPVGKARIQRASVDMTDSLCSPRVIQRTAEGTTIGPFILFFSMTTCFHMRAPSCTDFFYRAGIKRTNFNDQIIYFCFKKKQKTAKRIVSYPNRSVIVIKLTISHLGVRTHNNKL